MSVNAEKLHPKPPRKIKHYFTAIILVVLLWRSAVLTDSSFGELISGLPNMLDLLKEMFPRTGGILTTL